MCPACTYMCTHARLPRSRVPWPRQRVSCSAAQMPTFLLSLSALIARMRICALDDRLYPGRLNAQAQRFSLSFSLSYARPLSLRILISSCRFALFVRRHGACLNCPFDGGGVMYQERFRPFIVVSVGAGREGREGGRPTAMDLLFLHFAARDALVRWWPFPDRPTDRPRRRRCRLGDRIAVSVSRSARTGGRAGGRKRMGKGIGSWHSKL